jgi:hypothetical protein
MTYICLWYEEIKMNMEVKTQVVKQSRIWISSVMWHFKNKSNKKLRWNSNREIEENHIIKCTTM